MIREHQRCDEQRDPGDQCVQAAFEHPVPDLL